MKEVDVFATELLEEAKRFLEKAKDSTDEQGRTAFLNAALLLGMSSLEAHINAICQEMSERPALNIMDYSVLSEKEFVFDKGKFELTTKLRIYNIADRILFISKRFGLKGRQFDTTADWWSKLHQAIDKRNSLVHLKESYMITYEQVKSAFEGILGTLDATYMILYNQHFPALGRQLDSNMSF